MPHIIFLLLIASSPFYILGDETASWGSIQAGPSESECRPYIEKALQGASIHDSINESRETDDVGEGEHPEEDATITETSEDVPPDLSEPSNETEEKSGEIETQSTTGSDEQDIQFEQNTEESAESITEKEEESSELTTEKDEESQKKTEHVNIDEIVETVESQEADTEEQGSQETTSNEQNDGIKVEGEPDSQENIESEESIPETEAGTETVTELDEEGSETDSASVEGELEADKDTGNDSTTESAVKPDIDNESQEADSIDASEEKEETESVEPVEDSEKESTIEEEDNEKIIEAEKEEVKDESTEAEVGSVSEETQTEEAETVEASIEHETEKSEEIEASDKLSEEILESPSEETSHEVDISDKGNIEEQSVIGDNKSDSEEASENIPVTSIDEKESSSEQTDVHPDSPEVSENVGGTEEVHSEGEGEKSEEVLNSKEEDASPEGGVKTEEATPEEELSMIMEIPENLRSREHMAQILRLSSENEEIEKALGKIAESTLRELKKLYDVAIKPLEILYKYRDLSNRHFGDPEIFSKPLILFMGPWSGGKSTIINYLLENEYKRTALRTGAEPSPAYFNIVMGGEVEEVLDGTQLAADWTFSGLQKFGQGLLDRLRGLKLKHPLLEKVNIVEIPGILEIRKQVERLFPFNDACQWFIDRADIIFLVYDPSKLDVGPETEAILDQLKGREMQTRIILNKADQVKPEELMRVQGTLIWNISPLMSSTEPPIMYSTSLWSIPYENGSPTRLLYAQERAFLKDLRDAVDKRVENKIASARRFAVRVRNHAKMVDCYLTTYYNHKSFFGNKKKVSDDIIEHPQNYHIYEGLSTLTNISRYDLPDPDVYRDFFRLNPVYEFQQLSSTCTYFRGCPINRLDVAIAYDLPELVGKYKKHVEEIVNYTKK